MNVTVVIPVYNAAPYVERAVKSALSQNQTAEIILVEDGSIDNSAVICQGLMESDTRVKLLNHEGGKNKGAAASRNLGMSAASHDFIALLDADDYFLPGRFEIAEQVFQDVADCDGVYEAVGIEFQDERSKAQWLASPMGNVGLTTMNREVPPADLLHALLQGKFGRFHIDGMVFRKDLLEKSGLMNEKLASMHEDTDFIFRLSIAGRLYPGQLLSPVAVRVVHGDNRISAERPEKKRYMDRLKMHMETYRWCKKNGFAEQKNLLITRIANDCTNWVVSDKKMNMLSLQSFGFWARSYPEMLLERGFWGELILLIFSMAKRSLSRNER